MLLVSLGLIDLGFYTNAEQTAENVRALRRGGPVGEPARPHGPAAGDPERPGRDGRPLRRARSTRFNELLAKAVADLDEPRSPLLLASPPPSYDINHDTYDGTHPNASGEHKIAAAFADAMHQAWDVGGPYEA